MDTDMIVQNLRLSPYGFQTDMYYYIVNLFIYEHQRAEYLEQMTEIMKYLLVDSQIAELCLD